MDHSEPSGTQARFAAEIQELERLFAPRTSELRVHEHHHDGHNDHVHSPSSARERITYGVAAIGSLALSAFELKVGVAQDALGIVMDSLHNVGDALAYGFQAFAFAKPARGESLQHEAPTRKKARKAAAVAMWVAAGLSLLHTGKHADEFIQQGMEDPRQLLHFGLETGTFLPVGVGALGNCAISEWIIDRTDADHAVHAEAQEHAALDRRTSLKLLATALIPSSLVRPVVETTVGLWYGDKGFSLARRMWHSPDLAHDHAH